MRLSQWIVIASTLIPVIAPAQQSLKDNPAAYVHASDIKPRPKRTTTGLSLTQVMGTIRDIEMSPSSPVNGVQRVMGKSRDGSRTLEVLGNPADVSSVTLVAVHSGPIRNVGYEIEPIVRNCSPGLNEDFRDNWLRKASVAVFNGGKPQMWSSADRTITLTYVKSLRAFMVVVAPS